MYRIIVIFFVTVFVTVFVNSAIAQECSPDCDAGTWETARCGALCNVAFWESATVNNIKEVLAAGAPINAQNPDGWEPIHYAAMFGTVDMVNALLKAGADPNGHYAINAIESPLLVVSDPDRGQFHDELTSHFPRAQIVFYYRTRDRVRQRMGQIGVHRTLNESDARKRAKIVAALISAGVEINIRGYEGRSPLLNSVMYGNAGAVSLLIEAGAEVNIADDTGMTPLHHTVRLDDDLEIFTLLQNAGADLDAPNPDENTALHMSIGNRNDPLTHALIEAGANVNIQNDKGETPLYLLGERFSVFAKRDSEDAEIAELLLTAGAEVNALTNEGVSPLAALNSEGGNTSSFSAVLLEWDAEAIMPAEQDAPRECETHRVIEWRGSTRVLVEVPLSPGFRTCY